MSDSYSEENEATNEWDKLKAYLEFRRVTNGLWINCEPILWFKAITDHCTTIETIDFCDSGGGPLSGIFIKVCRLDLLYEISIRYDDCIANGFISNIDSAYKYMKSNTKGENLFEHACDYTKRNRNKNAPETHDTHINNLIDADLWCTIFGLDSTIGELPVIGGSLSSPKHDGTLPYSGFDFLTMTDKFEKGNIKPLKGLAKEVERAKQWAMVALLEMQRYYCTSC